MRTLSSDGVQLNLGMDRCTFGIDWRQWLRPLVACGAIQGQRVGKDIQGKRLRHRQVPQQTW